MNICPFPKIDEKAGGDFFLLGSQASSLIAVDSYTARWWRRADFYNLLGLGPCREQRSARWATGPSPFRDFSTSGTEWVLAMGRVKRKLCNFSLEIPIPEMGISPGSNSSLRSSFLLHTCFPRLAGPVSVIKNVNCNLAHYIQLGAQVTWDSQFHLTSTQRKKKNYLVLWYLWHIILVFNLC